MPVKISTCGRNWLINKNEEYLAELTQKEADHVMVRWRLPEEEDHPENRNDGQAATDEAKTRKLEERERNTATKSRRVKQSLLQLTDLEKKIDANYRILEPRRSEATAEWERLQARQLQLDVQKRSIKVFLEQGLEAQRQAGESFRQRYRLRRLS